MPDIDLFQLFRWVLGLVVGIYFAAVTAQSLWGWYIYLAGGDRYISMLRRYLLVQGLRMRFKAFWGDVIICGLLTVAFFMLWAGQRRLDSAEDALRSARDQAQHKVSLRKSNPAVRPVEGQTTG